MNSERLLLFARKFLQCRSSINQIDDDKKEHTHSSSSRIETPPTPSASQHQTAEMERYESVVHIKVANIQCVLEREKKEIGTRSFRVL